MWYCKVQQCVSMIEYDVHFQQLTEGLAALRVTGE